MLKTFRKRIKKCIKMILPYGLVRLWQKRFEYVDKMNNKSAISKIILHFLPINYIPSGYPVVLDADAIEILKKIR